jgi:predicted AAA+ superfamily ATPase
MDDKKEIFKILIKEFHEFKIPSVLKRDLTVPVRSKKIITITGPRRAGKTFYFYQLINKIKQETPFERILYINFEDDRILPLSLKDLNALLEAYFELYPEVKENEFFLFLDEIQNIEGWETFVRRIYDKENASIYITGSSSKILSREIATSLRGRTLNYKIYPLSFVEFLRFKGIELKPDFVYSKLRYRVKNLLNEYVNFGGFPEIVLAGDDLRVSILKNYYDLVIYRDLVERFAIRNVQLLKDMIKFLLTNVATTFSINAYYHTLLPQYHISRETILEYLSYLEEIELIQIVPIFSYSVKVQQVNPKKIYAIDNGLRNAVSFRFSQDEGRLVENLVFQHLKRLGFDVYYCKEKGEVDFVIKENNELTAINVSYGSIINDRETNGLLEFRDVHKGLIKNLLIITKDLEMTENGIRYVPLWKWLVGKEKGTG